MTYNKPSTIQYHRIVALAAFAILVVTVPLFAGGSGEPTPAVEPRGTITVASKIDTEGSLLGYMMLHILEDAGFAVNNQVEFGPTDVIRRAITSDEIDLYPEYTGNGAFFFGEAGENVWNDGAAGYERVRALDLQENDLVWLTPGNANNTWAIAVRSELVEAGVVTMDDIAGYMDAGHNFKLAASEEFVSRPDVLPAFEDAYGFHLEQQNLLVFSGGNTATTMQAAARNQDGVNAAMAYGTDGQLATLGLQVLEDTQGVQPVYQPAPVIRAEVLERHPEIEELMRPVFESFDREILQQLNASIAVEGRAAEVVAQDYLVNNGFID